jgi:CheY-like chemotaxis protein
MPGMDGMEVLSRLRAIRQGVRIIVWSGLSEEVAREQFQGLEGVTFMEKPSRIESVVEILQKALAR